jgi:glycosyltransferase involved in cell wall biosynthesis
MRRILFVAYHFPPVGGAGVQRNAKFARYLPEFGYESLVVTGAGTASGRWTPSDRTLNADVPAGTEVRRLPGPEPTGSSGWRGRSERWLGVRTPWQRWLIDGIVAAGREAADEFDLIYAGMAPYESAEAAARLARELGKPWVADLQDPWALDEMWIYPTRLHHRREIARMRRLLATADAIVMNTPESARRVRDRFPELRLKTIVTIPNGFDSADFEGPEPERTDGAFRIVHTGYLHTELGRHHRRAALARRLLGGANGQVDILTRSHVFLLEAIEQLAPDMRDEIEVHLAGVLSDDDRETGGRSSAVRMLGYVPHAESVALLRSADLLFLPLHNLPEGVRLCIVPGKTYEYLASGRPILGAVPDGDARDLLERAGGAFVCRPPDSEAMARLIEAEVERRRAGVPSRPDRSEVLPAFERRHLTERLAGVFDGLLDGVASPGRAAVRAA